MTVVPTWTYVGTASGVLVTALYLHGAAGCAYCALQHNAPLITGRRRPQSAADLALAVCCERCSCVPGDCVLLPVGLRVTRDIMTAQSIDWCQSSSALVAKLGCIPQDYNDNTGFLLWFRIAYACPATASLCNTMITPRNKEIQPFST